MHVVILHEAFVGGSREIKKKGGGAQLLKKYFFTTSRSGKRGRRSGRK